jgi:hypothetical protein
MKWIATYCNAQFILKVDDDIIVNTFLLLRHLKSMVDHKEIDKRTVMCHINRHMKVIRRKTSKWYVSPEEYSKSYYYKYCSGSGKTYYKIKFIHRILGKC